MAGRTWAARIDAVRTERELSEIYEDFIGMVPMGRRLFAGFTAYSEPFRSMVTELGGARRGPGDARPGTTTPTASEPAVPGGKP